MKNASAALIALLNSADEFFIADLLTVIPFSGSRIYLTNASTDIACVSQVDSLSHTFKSGGIDNAGTVRPTFTVGPTKTTIGTEVDNLDLALLTSVLATIGGLPWTQQARNGYFDGGRICLERAFTATWGVWTPGTLIRFYGRIGMVRPTRNTLVMPIVSDMVLLQRPMPRNTYQQGCLHNVYDAGCALNRATFTNTGAINATSTASVLQTNLASTDPNFYALGAITFTSGVNNGLTRTVQTYDTGEVTVVPPFPAAPANADTFSIYPGCDKLVANASGDVTLGTCKLKFNNLVHARGFPFIPAPEVSS